ncbi:hypothetical protein FJZ31_09440 [Candidatus Poribacteria bacterium]|nr:hypothetical protein [Candidatus Poribacteria bacterium]
MGILQLTIQHTADGYRVHGLEEGDRKALTLGEALIRVKVALEQLEPSPRLSLSKRYAKELKALEKLSDEELEAQAQAFMPKCLERRWGALMREEAQGRLTVAERSELEGLGEEFLRISAMKVRAQRLLEERRTKRNR